MTILIKKENLEEVNLHYTDGNNIFKCNGAYYLITQSDYGVMTIFELTEGMEWNRIGDPISVAWGKLTTENIGKYYDMFSKQVVEKVEANITIEIL